MKIFLQNLLAFFSICLCVLIAFQWVRESRLHQKLQSLANEVPDKAAAIQNLEGQLKRAGAEIERLYRLKMQLADELKTNSVEIFRLTAELEAGRKQIEADKSAIEKANENIRTQNEQTTKQNEQLKKLVAERNEAVEKFNKLAADYDELARKWNELQEQLKKK